MASPGANLASGYTEQQRQKALECERDNILSRFRPNVEVCCVPTQYNLGVVTKEVPLGSVLTQKAIDCGVRQARENALTFPKTAVSSGEYTARKQSDAVSAICNAFNAESRFLEFKRFEPPFPCPAPTTEQLNSTQPPAWMPANICQPSRFN
jgi:hypothetical protein